MPDLTDFTVLLAEIEAEYDRLTARIQRAQADLEGLSKKRDMLLEAMTIFREHYKLPSSEVVVDETMRQRLSGKTVKGMLIALATDLPVPVWRVTDVSRQLVKAGMFTDEKAARDGMYSTLGRNPKTFTKVGAGRYMLNPDRTASL